MIPNKQFSMDYFHRACITDYTISKNTEIIIQYIRKNTLIDINIINKQYYKNNR